jgi:anti-anti-sigma factor
MEIVRLPKVNAGYSNVDVPSQRPSAGVCAVLPSAPEEVRPMPPQDTRPDYVPAPIRLVAETRLEFRRSLLEALDRLALRGAAVIEIDLHATREVDASGLGILVLAQKRASQAQMRTRLVRVPTEVRRVLELTRLDHLFDM